MFTLRDSRNNKVDDIIEILSSSDDDVAIVTQIKRPRKVDKKPKSRFPEALDLLCREQMAEIIREVVESEVCVMADSEIFYNLEEPGWGELSSDDENEMLTREMDAFESMVADV